MSFYDYKIFYSKWQILVDWFIQSQNWRFSNFFSSNFRVHVEKYRLSTFTEYTSLTNVHNWSLCKSLRGCNTEYKSCVLRAGVKSEKYGRAASKVLEKSKGLSCITEGGHCYLVNVRGAVGRRSYLTRAQDGAADFLTTALSSLCRKRSRGSDGRIRGRSDANEAIWQANPRNLVRRGYSSLKLKGLVCHCKKIFIFSKNSSH